MECSARFLPRCCLSLESLQMSARMDVNSLEGTIPNYVSTPSGLFASEPLQGIVHLWQTLVKIFSESLSTIVKCHAVIAYHDTPINLDSKCQIQSSCCLSPSSAPADLSAKNGCTRLTTPLRLQVVITDNNLPRIGALRGWAALDIPASHVGTIILNTESHLLSSGLVLGYQIL